MTVPQADAGFDATPEQALSAIAGHRGPIVVDLDETLLLGNSTSLFLDSARPALLAYLVVKLVGVLRPRRRGASDPDDVTRRRITAVLTAMPWSRWWWQRRARPLASRLLNRPLIDAVTRAHGPVIVSTKGYLPVVEPLIAQAGLGNASIVAMDPSSGENRDDAKYRLTAEALGPDGLDRSLVITDSLADRRLLEASATPLRVTWPLTPPVDGLFSNVYLPGRYLAIKRPKAHYVRKIVKEDLAFWILGSVWLVDRPITHVLGLVALALSFWAFYELGYMDNDRAAERYEHDPALSDVYYSRAVRFRTWKPVLFAAVSGVAGLWILRWPDPPDIVDYPRWAGVLGMTWLTFRLYNRVDKQTRVLLYPLLQLARLGAFLAVVSTTAIADMALIIIALLRWVSYFVYRSRDGRWPTDDLTAIQLIVFASGSVLLASQHDWSDLIEPTTLSLLVWMAFLARRSLPLALANAHRIDRGPAVGEPNDRRANGSS